MTLALVLIKETVTFINALYIMCAIVESHDCSVIFMHHECCIQGSLKTNEQLNLQHLSLTKQLRYSHPTHRRVIPDRRTVCYQKGIKSMVYHAFLYEPQHNIKPIYFCPRSMLKKVYSDLQAHGLCIHIGFEIEFVVLNNKKEPFCHRNFCSSKSLDTASSLLHDITSELQCSGISVRQYHKESGSGQFEISSGVYSDPLMACDAMLITRKIISEVTQKQGHVASFLPKISNDLGTNSSHIHMSIYCREKGNITHEILELAEHNNNNWQGVIESDSYAVRFLAGILKHLPVLLALTCPTRNSFRRLVPGNWAGAYLCWGIENREAPLRLCEMNQLEDVNLEYKAFDSTSNPYIGLAGIIAAGIDGITEYYPLPSPVQICPNSTNIGSPEHFPPRLPKDPMESISRLQSDPWEKCIREALGEKAISLITAVRSCEARHFESITLEHEADILFDKY
eukprot:67658_1